MTDAPAHRAIYRRWRAQRFAEIIGQDPIVTTLRNAVRTDRVHHALLFVGPRGTGKTSTARILAKAINCTALADGEPDDACPSCISIREGRALDVVELDAASNNKVDDMRSLLERTWTAPADLRTKVFIIDEVQRIREGWDVLLKTLEEPPPHVVFIFCTTDPSQIRPAVVSRVQRFDFRRLGAGEIEGKLRTILAAEGRVADDDAIALIARLAAGGMRDAESMLDQLLSTGDGAITATSVRELLGLADDESVAAFLDALGSGDAAAGLAVLDDLDARGRDMRTFLDQLVDALRAILTAELAGGVARDDAAALRMAARGLAALDPTRQGPGGLRFSLEVMLLETAPFDDRGSPIDESSPVRAGARSDPPAGPEPVRIPPPATEAQASLMPPEPAPILSPDPAPILSPEPAPILSPDPVPIESTAPAYAPPEETTPVVPVGPAPAPSTSEDRLAALVAQWPEIVAHISRHPPTRPLIAVCRPIAVDGTVVTLGFPEGMAFLADVAERRRANLEEGIALFLGGPVAVRCVATNLDLAAPMGATSDADRLIAEARRIFADDIVEVPEVAEIE